MKRLLAVFLTVMLAAVALLGVPMVAYAAPSLSMQINVSPTSLVSGGTVEMNVVVSNSGDAAAQNVSVVYDGNTLAELGNIEPGDSKTYNEPNFSVSSDQLGKGIKIEVKYTYGENGENGSISQTVTVAKKEATVDVETSVKVDKETVAKGGEVVFTFAVENKGNVAIENAEIKASVLNSGKPVSDKFTVAAGDAKVINYTATVYKDLKVEPILLFTAAGQDKSQSFETVNLSVSEAGASISAVVDKEAVLPEDEISFNINIANTGNTDFTSMTLTDGANNSIPMPQNTLTAGSSMTVNYKVKPEASGAFCFYLTATDSTGQTYTFQSNEIMVEVEAGEETPSATPAPIVDPDAALTIDLEVSPEKLAEPGPVNVKLVIHNNADYNFTNVKISERTLGELQVIDQLPPGEATYTTTIELPATVEALVTVTATAQDGSTVTVTSEPITIRVGEDAADGEKKPISPILIIIIVVAVLIVAVVVVLIVLVAKDKKKKNNLEAEQENARRERVAMRQDAYVSSRQRSEDMPRRTNRSFPEQRTYERRSPYTSRVENAEPLTVTEEEEYEPRTEPVRERRSPYSELDAILAEGYEPQHSERRRPQRPPVPGAAPETISDIRETSHKRDCVLPGETEIPEERARRPHPSRRERREEFDDRNIF